jgi:hypothetical protein
LAKKINKLNTLIDSTLENKKITQLFNKNTKKINEKNVVDAF